MEAKINERGTLFVQRGSKLQVQYCPFEHSSYDVRCGDWCPHFGEPTLHNDIDFEKESLLGKTSLALRCGNGRVFYFTKFEDQR